MTERKWCVVDGEGDAGERGLLGCAIYSDAEQVYEVDPIRIRAYLQWHAQHGYTFVAHNAAYDLGVVFWQLDIPMRAHYYNSTFTYADWKWHPKRSAAQLWDSFNLAGRVPLEALGESMGCPKYTTPAELTGEDRSRYEWKCDRHDKWECIECYAVRDAEIVYRYMESYARTMAGWSLAPSRRIAGSAVAAWRNLDKPNPIRLDDGRIRHLARRSYFGGRTEVFKYGHLAPLYTADVASMYPSVMLETAFPDPSRMLWADGLHPDQLPLEREGVAECLVAIPQCYIPPLPNARAGQREFRIGLQRGFWTFLELRYALSLGVRLLKVYRAAWSEASLHPFTMFVSVLWEMRQEYKRKGDARAQTVKVLLNSCYGRLGIRGADNQECIVPWDASLSQKIVSRSLPETIGDRLYLRYETPIPMDHDWHNVLWASYITAAARVKLHRSLLLQGSSAAYCDTDSVFSTQPIQGLGEGLGALTDHTTYARGWLVGPKLYRLEPIDGDPIVRAKGIPRALAGRFLRGEEVVFDSPISPRAQSRTGIRAGTWVPITRERQLVPARRHILSPDVLQLETGWSDTAPLVFTAAGF